MDRKTRLIELRRKRARAVNALAKADTQANQTALEDAETELANAEADAKDDERLASVSVGLMPLVDQLAQTAAEPLRSWAQCVKVAAVLLEDAQRSKKDGSAIDPERLAGQAEQLIEALTRVRPQ